MTLEERFWAKVEKTDGCWLWTGSKNARGYGFIYVGKQTNRRAHRIGYELLVGPIPEGLELDHLCRNPSCVNPDHLEPVTHAENTRRSPIVGRHNLAKTHCPRGHPYAGENLRIATNGQRKCRACERERSARAYRKRCDEQAVNEQAA